MSRRSKQPRDQQRKKTDAEISYRVVGVTGRSGGPSSVDEAARSVEFVAATENPVPMYDWEHGVIDEVLLMKGCQMPASKQIPLLDTHSRYTTADVVGSARALRVDGEQLLATAVFSQVASADDVFRKIQEGHITDVSIGYRVFDSTTVPEGEKAVIAGRTWKGPVKVATSWAVKELSVCPIGADEAAKARAEGQHVSVNLEPNTNPQGEKTMNKKLRARLEGMGLRKEATEDEAWEFWADQVAAARAEPAPAAGTIDADAIRADARASIGEEADRIARDEKQRCIAIRTMGRKFGLEDLADELIDAGTSIADAQTRCLDRLGERTVADDATGQLRIVVGREDRDKRAQVIEHGLLVRSGLVTGEARNAHSTEFASRTIFECFSEMERVAGGRVNQMTKDEFFGHLLSGRALSSSDFSNIMANVAHNAVLAGFEAADETYGTWADTTGNVTDFKAHQFSRTSEAPSLEEVNPEGGEYKYGKLTDKKESVTATDYGKIVPYTRGAMVNDNLGELTDTLSKLGLAASRKYGDLVYACLAGTGSTMGDGNALFDASNHSNYATGAGAPSATTFNTAMAAMGQQTDIQGLQYLNVRPVFVLAPFALWGTVQALVRDTSPTATQEDNNYSFLTPVYDGRLGGQSTTAWYLAARKGMTVKLYTLGGELTPKLERKEGWVTDGIEFKTRVTAVAHPSDWVGLYKHAGA